MSKHTVSNRQQNEISATALYTGHRWQELPIRYDFCISSLSTVENGVEQVKDKIIVPQDTEGRFHPIFSIWENVADISFTYIPSALMKGRHA